MDINDKDSKEVGVLLAVFVPLLSLVRSFHWTLDRFLERGDSMSRGPGGK
jgi:hypothetical protein